MAKVIARWGGQKVAFDVEAASGHRVHVDSAADFGDDEGIQPTELLLASLATCTGVNAVLLLQKFRQPLTALSVEVDADRERDWPKRFTKIYLTFVLKWDSEPDRKLVAKALDLACNRYCPVHATLAHGVQIEVSQREPAA